MSGTKFVYEKVKVMCVVTALYVLKSSGTYFRDLLSEQLHGLGYGPYLADPGVCMRPAVK